MIYLPFIGALLESVGVILEKKILRSKKLDYGNYTVYSFFSIFLLMSFFAYFFWFVDSKAFEYFNLLILFLVVIVSVFANLLVFYSLKREKMSEFEPIWMMQPLFTVFLAFIMFKDERNLFLLIPAAIAGITLILAHWDRNHFSFDRYILATLFGSFLFAVELVLSKFILSYYSPFTFYFVRCFFVFLIVFLIYRPNGKEVSLKNWTSILSISSLWIFYRAIMYYGYSSSGIIYTTLLFSLSPILIFMFASIFLREKIKLKQIISAIIILACVLSVFFINGKS